MIPHEQYGGDPIELVPPGKILVRGCGLKMNVRGVVFV